MADKTTRKVGPAGIVIVLTLVGCLLVACGSSPSAAQQVCSDRANLKSAMTTVIEDLRAGKFSAARNDVPAVKDAFNSLRQSAKNLQSQQAQALQPQVDKLKSTLANLENAKSLSELRTGLESANSQIQTISNEIVSTLNCS